MYIVIAGAGLVGGAIAKALVGNKHDVVVIEQDKQSAEKLFADTGVVVVQGDAAEIETLRDAGIDKADIVIGATGNDATNLAFSLLCQSLAVSKVIVRMRNSSYEKAYRLSGADSIVRVTDMMVGQILYEVEQPDAHKVADLAYGTAEIYSVRVHGDAKACGMKIMDIVSSAKFPKDCNFAAIYRRAEGTMVIPRGEQTIEAEDEVYIVVSAKNMKQAIDSLTERERRR